MTLCEYSFSRDPKTVVLVWADRARGLRGGFGERSGLIVEIDEFDDPELSAAPSNSRLAASPLSLELWNVLETLAYIAALVVMVLGAKRAFQAFGEDNDTSDPRSRRRWQALIAVARDHVQLNPPTAPPPAPLPAPYHLSARRYEIVLSVAALLWATRTTANPLPDLHPTNREQLSHLALWNVVVVVFVLKCCPQFTELVHSELAEGILTQIQAVLVAAATSPAGAEAGGAITQPAKRQFDASALDASSGRVRVYLSLFFGITVLGPLFVAAVTGGAIVNVVVAGFDFTTFLVCLHVNTVEGGRHVLNTCGHVYVKCNLETTRFYVGLARNWVVRNGHSLTRLAREPLAWYEKKNTYNNQAVGNDGLFSGYCTSAAQNWLVFSLGIPIERLNGSEWVLHPTWLVKHGFEEEHHGLLISFISMIIEELEALAIILFFPALVATNQAVRGVEWLLNSMGCGPWSGEDQRHGTSAADRRAYMTRLVWKYLRWIMAYGQGPHYQDWIGKFPLGDGETVPAPSTDEDILTQQYAVVSQHKRDLVALEYWMYLTAVQCWTRAKGHLTRCAFIVHEDHEHARRCPTQLVEDRRGMGFCEEHKNESIQCTQYALAGSNMRRLGPFQAGTHGVARTQEAHASARAVAVTDAEDAYVFKGKWRCFARVSTSKGGGGQCRKKRAAKNDVCAQCKDLHRSADPEFKTAYSATT
jgi:hypothetical protein